MRTSSTGRSRASVSIAWIVSTTSMPLVTWPNAVCLPSSHGGAGVGHRQRAADDLVVVDLVLELVARAARADAVRASALDHEVGDHAVEDQPVVEALAGQLGEVGHGLGRVVGEPLQLDRSVVGLDGGIGIGHVGLQWSRLSPAL